jgi:hypothetical protein
VDIVGIRGDGNGGKFSPAAGIGGGEKCGWRGTGKQPPHILCPVDIPNL